MPWTRLGVVFVPDGSEAWARSHAALPVPVQIGSDIFRFFFSTRDAANRSHVGWADLDLSSAPRVLREASEPVLAPGEDGAFDDSGIGIGCLTQADDGVRLYYMGWNLGVRSAWRNAVGLAQARTPLDRFERFSPGPILDRSPEDPYTLAYPWVLRPGPQDWWMWYPSSLSAKVSGADMRYAIKAARSRDGIRWERDGASVVGFSGIDDQVITRPSVVQIGSTLLMAFCCRGENYRVGFAVSSDKINWTRIDAAMRLDPTNVGWESRMTCYAAPFLYRGRLWLAYNGDGYGATGFGLAVWEGDLPI